jgi:hypothetical protein
MEKISFFRKIFLALTVVSAVLLVGCAALTVVFGMKMNYVPMGVFAVLTLGALYALPACIVEYRDHGTMLRLFAAFSDTELGEEEIAAAVGLKPNGVLWYTKRMKERKYVTEQSENTAYESV